MNSEEILKWWESEDNKPIYGYMYGHPYVFTCGINGEYWKKDEIIKIEKKELELGDSKDCFIFIWGGPGPDYNVYNFADYGITWAFLEEEISNDYVMEQIGNEWRLVKNMKQAKEKYPELSVKMDDKKKDV